MITKWGLKNFKSIREADLELAPLTVFTGVNSSGKSSFLQSIGLMAQSAINNYSSAAFPDYNGFHVKLGDLYDIFHNKSQGSKPSINIKFSVKSEENEDVSANIEFGYNHEARHSEKSLAVNLIDNSIEGGYPKIEKIMLNHPFNLNDIKNNLKARSYYYDNIEKFFNILLKIPSEVFLSKDEAEVYLEKIINEENAEKDLFEVLFSDFNGFIGHSEKTKLLVPLCYIFNEWKKYYYENKDTYNINLLDWYFVMSKLDSKSKININKDQNLNIIMGSIRNYLYKIYSLSDELHDQFVNKCDIFQDCLKRVSYLGPMRGAQKSEYDSINNEKQSKEDIYKAALISFFNEKRYEVERYISPASIDKNEKEKKILFSDALKEWFRYILSTDDYRIETNYETEKIKFLLNYNGIEYDLLQQGTGVSQVVPIIVMCLVARPGTTIIVQQPEEQLHPKVQSRLADFFIAMALTGRQCLIETHSEYFIYMLRYRIAKAFLQNDDSIQKAVKIFFVEKKDGESEFKEVKVNKHGEIMSWPDDFFDERQKLSDMMLDVVLAEMDGEND